MGPIKSDQEVAIHPADNQLIHNEVEFWKKTYDDNNLFWLVKSAHPFLSKNVGTSNAKDALIKNPDPSNAPKKIFVPLCGTTHDLSFLLSQGFLVFGIECVKSCFDILNERDRLGLVYNAKDSTYETADKRLIIYWGDFEKCDLEKFGPFDYIWDRASFCAIDQPLRPAYARMINRALGKDKESVYYVEVVSYNKNDRFSGPPRSVPEREVRFHYSVLKWNVRLLQRAKVNENSPFFHKVPTGLDAEESIYMITRR